MIAGNLVASFPAVPHDRLFYRRLECQKIIGLKQNQRNFDKEITLGKDHDALD